MPFQHLQKPEPNRLLCGVCHCPGAARVRVENSMELQGNGPTLHPPFCPSQTWSPSMKLLSSILIAVLVLPAAARIGEDPKQLVTRYGPSTPGRDTAELLFEKNGIAITATLWKGVCHSIRFGPVQATGRRGIFGSGFVHPGDMPAPAPPKEGGKPLTEDQLKQLLEANSGGSPWVETKKNSWTTKDSKRSAFILSDGDLCIATAEFILHDGDSRKGKETERTEGF